MKRVKFLILILFFSLFFVQNNKAQNCSAYVNPTNVYVDVPFEYSAVFNVKADKFTPPDFKDFEVVAGPNQSNTTEINKGITTQTVKLTYKLIAKKAGTFVIGSASATWGGQRFETPAVKVKCTE